MGYSFDHIGESELTIDNILSRIPDEMLWRYYLGVPFVLGRTIKAQYRTDNNPSFNLKLDVRKNRIVGKDYGKGGFHGDIFDYVMRIYSTDFYSALVKVNQDFNLGLTYNPERYKLNSTGKISRGQMWELRKFKAAHDKVYSEITGIRRRFNEKDLEYWGDYGIDEGTLLKYNVHAARRLELNGQPLYNYDKSPGNPCYVYMFPITPYRAQRKLKCYWPYSQSSLRFLGNANNLSDVQGYDQCSISRKEHGELLVLTKSLKDCMLLSTFNIESMATHGENQKFQDDFIRHIKKYYRRIISLYDRDETGIKGARWLWKTHHINPYFINKVYGCKDITDLYKEQGKELTQGFVDNIRKER